MTKIGALVPARIGSKRLPKKNIKILGDKPLICWTIDVLLESDIFYDITVSTESDEIADVVRQYYSEKEVKILKRPEELAQDDSPMREVISHYLKNRPNLDWFGTFLPTFPFRRKDKLLEAYRAILSRYPWKIESVTEEQYCLMDFFYPVEDGVMRFFRMPPIYCRYGIPVYYLENVHYPADRWYQYGLTFMERVYQLTVTKKEQVDIDTVEDFRLAQTFLDKDRDLNQLSLTEVRLNEDWIFVYPKSFYFNRNALLENLQEELSNTSQPLLVLKPIKFPVSFLKIFDGQARNYIESSEAYNYMYNPKVIETQNLQYSYKQYKHSSHFRFIRCNLRNFSGFPFSDTDLLGCLYKSGCGSKESLIPKKRIIWEHDLISIMSKQ